MLFRSRGNMLILPVGKGLLYVEPIYLQSKSNDLPTLVRVVVTDGRRIVMERDLAKALDRLVALPGATAAGAEEDAGLAPQAKSEASGGGAAVLAPRSLGIEVPGFTP